MNRDRIAFVNAGEELLLKVRAVARRTLERARHVTGRPKVVLVVENDPGTRQVIATLLRQEGHVVEEARDGREALERLRAGLRPDGIVLDLLLPYVNGRQFRDEQVRDRDLRNIPLIVVSGEPGAPHEAAEMGASPAWASRSILTRCWRPCGGAADSSVRASKGPGTRSPRPLSRLSPNQRDRVIVKANPPASSTRAKIHRTVTQTI